MKTLWVYLEEGVGDDIRRHPAVQEYHPNFGEHFVNLKKGYHWSGQHSFGTETAGQAKKMLKQVKKCDCERCKT